VPAVICFVGSKNSGKTTLLTRVIERLKARSYKVGVIKHAHDHDFLVDQPGKDSHRCYEAGADAVVIASDVKCAMIKRMGEPLAPDGLIGRYLSDMDVVLVEGYKSLTLDKIEVFRREVAERPLALGEDRIALVTDDDVDLGVPRYGFDEVDKLTHFIMHRLDPEPP